MGLRQAWHDIRELRREIAELTAPSSEEEEAGYKLAVSATRFSRRSRRVVDDKLNFSATLMRAGEVDAANRLLEEFERDIRDEEAALIECVNEVKVASSLRRQRLGRLRVVRLMAVALLGACVMSFSALGIAVAGMFHDREHHSAAARAARGSLYRTAAAKPAASKPTSRSRRSMRALELTGARDALTPQQIQTYVKLAASGDDAQLQDFLLSVLPGALAQKVSTVLGVAAEVVGTPSPQPELNTSKVEAKAKKTSDKAADESTAADDSEPPAKDDSPPPSDSGDQQQSSKDGGSGGHGGGSGGGDDDSDGTLLPGDGGFGGS